MGVTTGGGSITSAADVHDLLCAKPDLGLLCAKPDLGPCSGAGGAALWDVPSDEAGDVRIRWIDPEKSRRVPTTDS
ncbi:hypothetical protein [Saccharothrix yanglingensis]|uniref:hypothetical protein n=1 Tax=Saccharothrix yanglingensis TaxID=659496 RepID=UPI0027D2737C|nr:hypothetical protein [Saccharothrix yanglingensis]